MRNILKNKTGRVSDNQKGFTLIEILIVVGIIVGLSAVIIPLVIQFAFVGEDGANATEFVTVQTSIDQAMVINTTETVAPRALGAIIVGTEDLTGVGDPMSNYIRDLPTVCQYTWLGTGLITQTFCP